MAFKALAKRWHPDTNSTANIQESEHMIKTLYEARDTLMDDTKRERYDIALGLSRLSSSSSAGGASQYSNVNATYNSHYQPRPSSKTCPECGSPMNASDTACKVCEKRRADEDSCKTLYCSKCGARVYYESSLCPDCISQQQGDPIKLRTRVETKYANPLYSPKSRKQIGCFVLAFACFVAFAAFLLFITRI